MLIIVVIRKPVLVVLYSGLRSQHCVWFVVSIAKHVQIMFCTPDGVNTSHVDCASRAEVQPVSVVLETL